MVRDVAGLDQRGGQVYQLNGAWFEMTPHAVGRAIDMAVDEDAIKGVLADPRDVRRANAGREMWTRGKVTAVVEARDGYWAVITFMWSTAAGWAAEQVASRSEGLSAERSRAMRYAIKQRKRGRRVR